MTAILNIGLVVLVAVVWFLIARGRAKRRHEEEKSLRDSLIGELRSQLDETNAALVQLRSATAIAQPKPAPRKCGTCIHFDLEAGQKAMSQNHPFAQAAQVLAPWQMGSTVQYDAAGQVIPPKRTAKNSRVGWSDLGACHLREEGVFKTFTCPNWYDAQLEPPEHGFDEPVPLDEVKAAASEVPTATILDAMDAEETKRQRRSLQLLDASLNPAGVDHPIEQEETDGQTH